jgi:hypothetical protein
MTEPRAMTKEEVGEFMLKLKGLCNTYQLESKEKLEAKIGAYKRDSYVANGMFLGVMHSYHELCEILARTGEK